MDAKCAMLGLPILNHHCNLPRCFDAFGMLWMVLDNASVDLCNFVPQFAHVLTPPHAQECRCFSWELDIFPMENNLLPSKSNLNNRATRKKPSLCFYPTCHTPHPVAFSTFFVRFTFCAECRHTRGTHSEPGEDPIAVELADLPRTPPSEHVSSASAHVSTSAAISAMQKILLFTATLQSVKEVPLATRGSPLAAPNESGTIGFGAGSRVRVPMKHFRASAAPGRIFSHSNIRQPEGHCFNVALFLPAMCGLVPQQSHL